MAVVRLGGFRRAAESLGVEQSAVSRRIRGLEEELGVSLFHRSTRGAEPTNAGRQFLRRVDALLNGLRLAISDARAAGAGQSGHLRIGLTFSMLSDGLFNLIERFHGAHPAVTIEMVEGRAIDHLDAVADRRLDVAMLPEGMTVSRRGERAGITRSPDSQGRGSGPRTDQNSIRRPRLIRRPDISYIVGKDGSIV